ncbi:MAG: hypothetical protein AB1896_11090 [Thermodesulfobacteriota bacterium]
MTMVIDVFVLSTAAAEVVGVYQHLVQAYGQAKQLLQMDNVYAEPSLSFEQAREALADLDAVVIGHSNPRHGRTQVTIRKYPLALDDTLKA